MTLSPRYQRTIARQKQRTAKYWDLLIVPWIEAGEVPMLGFQFRVSDEDTARSLAERLRALGTKHVEVERRSFALWGRWKVHGYDAAPSKQIDQVNAWIERMITIGAEFGAQFYGWSPGRPIDSLPSTT